MINQTLSLDQLRSWLPQWIKTFSNKQIILLKGDLGAGKTALTREVLKAMGCEEVNSPTYGLIHEYDVPGLQECVHVDLYRLKDLEDLESSGFWDIFSKESGLIFIEWSDRIPLDQYPLQWAKWAVEIDKGADDQSRSYTFKEI